MKRVSNALLALVLAFCAAAALPQQYPAKPIRFIVGFPPGGSADPTTRIMGQALSEQMGQPLLVENRPGADSAIAAEQMTCMPADGYTIMFASNSAMTAAVALRKLPREIVERLLEINREDLALWRKLVREANIPLE